MKDPAQSADVSLEEIANALGPTLEPERPDISHSLLRIADALEGAGEPPTGVAGESPEGTPVAHIARSLGRIADALERLVEVRK